MIALGRHHTAAFEILRPGIDSAAVRRKRVVEGWRYEIRESDLYPDVRHCFQVLRRRRLRIGIAGNQPKEAEHSLRELRLPVDFILSSKSIGYEKPNSGFLAKVVEAIEGVEAREVAYVGDRQDNDIAPAQSAGMRAIQILRGPWARFGRARPTTECNFEVVESLDELPELLDMR